VTSGRNARITSRVGLGTTGHGGFMLSVSLDLHAPQLSAEQGPVYSCTNPMVAMRICSLRCVRAPTTQPEVCGARPVSA
jgi:hypothetical protein